MSTTKSDQSIDIKQIFHEKNPKLARLIPGFVMRYVKKIAHEDFINDVIRDYGHLKGFDFSEAMIELFNLTLKVKGEENLPGPGRYIFVSNHPLGGLDGHVIMYLVGKKYGKYKFLVNDILMGLKNLNDVFIPVNKHGRQGVELAKQIDEAYESDIQILTFPAGMVSRKIDGKVMDLEWQKNFVTKAIQHQRNVIPIHITGGNTKFFYRLYNFRKFFGIKANIEMLYLIDETYKHHNKNLTITFGKPIPWETFDKSKRPAAWAQWVKDLVYKLADT
jgi:1-acyl-sn-glycerol-3-phosphate acyltransferase